MGARAPPCRDARPGGISVFTVSNIHEAGHGVCLGEWTNGRSNGRFSYSPIRRATSLCHRIAFPSFTDQLRSPGVKFSNDFSRAGVGAYVHSGSTSAPCRRTALRPCQDRVVGGALDALPAKAGSASAAAINLPLPGRREAPRRPASGYDEPAILNYSNAITTSHDR